MAIFNTCALAVVGRATPLSKSDCKADNQDCLGTPFQNAWRRLLKFGSISIHANNSNHVPQTTTARHTPWHGGPPMTAHSAVGGGTVQLDVTRAGVSPVRSGLHQPSLSSNRRHVVRSSNRRSKRRFKMSCAKPIGQKSYPPTPPLPHSLGTTR